MSFRTSINTNNPSSASGVDPSHVTTQGTSRSGSDAIFRNPDGSVVSQSERQGWIKPDQPDEQVLATKPTLAQIATYVTNQVKFTDKNYNTRFAGFHQSFLAAVKVFDAAFKELFVPQVDLKYRLQNNLTVTAKNAVEQRISIEDEGAYPKLWDAFQALGGLQDPYNQARGEASKDEVPEEHKPIWLKRCDGYRKLMWCARNILIEVINAIAEGTLVARTEVELGGAVTWTGSWLPKGIPPDASVAPPLVDDGSTISLTITFLTQLAQHNHFTMSLPPSSFVHTGNSSSVADPTIQTNSGLTGGQSASQASRSLGSASEVSLKTMFGQDGKPLKFYPAADEDYQLEKKFTSLSAVWKYMGGPSKLVKFDNKATKKDWNDNCQQPFADALAKFEEALLVLVGNPTWMVIMYNNGALLSRPTGELKFLSAASGDTLHKLWTAWATYYHLLTQNWVIRGKELPAAEKERWQMKLFCCERLCTIAKKNLLEFVDVIRPGTIVGDRGNQELEVRWKDPHYWPEDEPLPTYLAVLNEDDVPSLAGGDTSTIAESDDGN
ncbi:hypothetical protein HD553DRAFT_333635 [Filobasidium floriforme]|uniref:uncharacterized protein n=1 Tax=Filobasidium floriforme TaxID=5210 RepID=UPI001E8D7DFB|nr:uncharacterized protein HD553DRAFT_333635 [Filobasidium floriforme]KAH8089010.1 hypothetical protein HD553DRAFT_333635 [Filobasidium floriforme]